mmetsp:Transcript_131768/g.256631  ORF Transcript_131768/g.256631 Transcript_131768/m.256631 type:complete len:776 (+) Transcript_131768:1-2328(+)
MPQKTATASHVAATQLRPRAKAEVRSRVSDQQPARASIITVTPREAPVSVRPVIDCGPGASTPMVAPNLSTPVGTPSGRAPIVGTPSSPLHVGWTPTQAVGSTSPTPTTSSPLAQREGAKAARSTEDEALFELFSAALAKPGTASVVCKHLFPRSAEPDFQVSWEELQEFKPLQTLAHAVACALPGTDRPAVEIQGKDICQKLQEWWRALLACHGLHCRGDTIKEGKLRVLVTAAIRMLRDRHACMAYLRNLRTVPRASHRLKDRYTNFEFISRGSQGKTYKCRSRLTREEHVCRQIRKDRIKAPADHVRLELECLRNVEHPHLLQVTESFEDFNSIYMVVELVEGVELLQFLQQKHASGKCLTESWFAEVIQQVLHALAHCHELQPRGIVHGDLRMSSIILALISDADRAPHVILADLGLAGLPLPPPPLQRLGQGATTPASATARLKLQAEAEVPMLARAPSPKLDVWSCGCLIFVLLAGRHPFGCDDLGASLLPPVIEVGATSSQPDWSLLGHVSQSGVDLCSKMLASEAEKRPTAAACLADPWFAILGPPSDGEPVPMEVLASLMQLHARSKFRQVVTNLIVSELSDSPFSCAGAALAVMGACGDKGHGLVSVPELANGLQQLGVSSRGIEEVVRAFDPDGCGSVEFGRLSSSCAELAEDLLDHALWRVFTAAGEDHRGVLGSAELEQALQDRGERAIVDDARPAVSGDQAGGAEPAQKSFGPELKANEIVRQLARGGNEVTFEELKDMVVLRQSTAYVAALSEGLPSTSL